MVTGCGWCHGALTCTVTVLVLTRPQLERLVYEKVDKVGAHTRSETLLAMLLPCDLLRGHVRIQRMHDSRTTCCYSILKCMCRNSKTQKKYPGNFGPKWMDLVCSYN